jgi:hypothetical protein
MDEAFTQLIHTGTIVFGVSIIMVTFFIRKLVETAVPSVQKKADENAPAITYETTFSRYWNQVILYALPPVVGALIGILDVPFLYGEDGAKTMLGRVFTGVFVGGVSAFVYKSAKKRWGINLETGLRQSTKPPPANEVQP